jgi:transposase InsO family protein
VPEWKWEEIGMDFVTGLPRTQKGNDSIWVIIDRLTKVAHFVPVKTTFGGATLARIYLKEIVRLHGIPRKIVSDRGTQFTSKFWKGLQQAMGTKLDFSTAYHPQSDGQTERVNKILEDLLRACATEIGSPVCRTPNSHTTTAIRPASKCHRSKHFMEENARLP